MKYLLALTVIFVVFACSKTQAASWHVVTHGGNVFSIYLDGGADNGSFDAIALSITPVACSSLVNPDPLGLDFFTPRPAGDESTFVNAFLGVPIPQGGNGFSILGKTVTENGLAFTAGPLGVTIDTVNGPNVGRLGLFLANFAFAGHGVNVEAQLFSAGNVIDYYNNTIPLTIYPDPVCPEPTSLLLAGLGLLGFVGVRRHNG